MIIHKGLTLERWFTFSLYEQLANVGAEIGRTIYWKKTGDLEHSRLAFERALELLDFTIRDPKHRGARLKELVRTREALIDHFVYDNEYQTTDELWDDYFYAFNYAAALQRGR